MYGRINWMKRAYSACCALLFRNGEKGQKKYERSPCFCYSSELTGQHLDVDGVGLAAGRATGVVACVGFVGVLDLQLAVRPASVVRLHFDAVALRLEVQQHVVVEPEDEVGRNRALKS